MKNIILIILFLSGVPLFAQKISTISERYICWQDTNRLSHNDFEGKVGDCGPEVLDNVNFKASGCMGVWSILDIPTSWKKGVKYEKFYFAPMFDKSTSWTKTTDSIEILKQQVYFDLCEISCRWARRELYNLRKQTGNATGTTAIYFTTVKDKMNEFRLGMYAGYFDAVFRTNNLDSLESWTAFTHEMLNENQEYATKQEDCQRLLTGIPEKGYKQPDKIIGTMENSKIRE